MATTLASKTIKIKTVETLKDVKTFFQQMNTLYGLEWDPDEDFEDREIEEIADGQKIQSLMNQSFEVCENLNIDIYEFGMEVNHPLRKIYGIGTDYDEPSPFSPLKTCATSFKTFIPYLSSSYKTNKTITYANIRKS